MKRSTANSLANDALRDGDNYTQGYQRGQRWAKTKASFFELDRLARLGQSNDGNWADWVGTDGCSALLAREIRALEGQEAQFWSDAVGPGHTNLTANTDFILGFIEGSMEVYDQVAIHLGHS